MIPLHKGRADGLDAASAAAFWGSILPAVWNFMLALRARGLGSAWTTMHLYHEREAAELLGIPYDGWTQAGLFPVAYTKGTDFKPAPRIPLDEVVHWDEWWPSRRFEAGSHSVLARPVSRAPRNPVPGTGRSGGSCFLDFLAPPAPRCDPPRD